jgi:hypothetical protein
MAAESTLEIPRKVFGFEEAIRPLAKPDAAICMNHL